MIVTSIQKAIFSIPQKVPVCTTIPSTYHESSKDLPFIVDHTVRHQVPVV